MQISDRVKVKNTVAAAAGGWVSHYDIVGLVDELAWMFDNDYQLALEYVDSNEDFYSLLEKYAK